MAGPFDYSLNVQQNPTQSFAQGYGLGQGIRDDFQRQEAMQRAAESQAAQQKALQGLIANPNAGAQDYSAASLMFPQLREQVKQSWEIKNTAQQEANLRDMGQAYSAVLAGRPDIASKQLQGRADAMEKAGANPAEIQALRTQAQVMEANPQFARTTMGLMLSSLPGGDKVLAGVSSAGQEQRASEQAPADLATKNAQAGIKAVEAANAPTATALANENAVEDAESKRSAREIARLNTQISQANSETQRGELVMRRDELQQKQDEKKLAKGVAAQDQLTTLTQVKDTLGRIKASPAVEGWFTGAGTIGGKQLGYLPGTDRKELNALIDTFKSQQFLASLAKLKEGGPSGLGGLTESEGNRLVDAIGKLDPDMKPQAFKNTIGVIEKTIRDAESRVAAGGNLPTTGGGFVMKHPTFGNVTEGDINRMMASQPGSTREQVLQYLSTTGGKQSGGSTGSY